MPLHALSPRRLASVAALACAAALIPVAALAAAASPAAPAAAASTPACATSGLVIWMNTQGNGYAGGVGYTLNFTNLSGRRCNLRGYPGVSATSLSGGQLGTSAGWGSARPRTVILASGATATALLQIADVHNFNKPNQPCSPVTAAGLRVYPPNQLTSKVIPFPFGACSRSGPVWMRAGLVQK
jgi:hypothetical protein